MAGSAKEMDEEQDAFLETALRNLVRDVVRDELRYLREEILGWIQTPVCVSCTI